MKRNIKTLRIIPVHPLFIVHNIIIATDCKSIAIWPNYFLHVSLCLVNRNIANNSYYQLESPGGMFIDYFAIKIKCCSTYVVVSNILNGLYYIEYDFWQKSILDSCYSYYKNEMF